MSDWENHLVNLLLYGGLTRETYGEIVDAIRLKNLRTLSMSAALSAIVLAALSVCSFLLDGVAQNRTAYLVLFAVSVSLHILCRTVLPRRQSWVLPCFYLYLIAAFAFGALLGAPLQPEVPATTFCVLLFALPLLIIDRPWRISVVLLIASMCFCAASAHYKAPSIFLIDAINVVSFLFLGVMVNFFVSRTKIREVWNTRYITRERDTDELTGLTTKSAARREVLAYMQHCREDAALLIFDIDNFKYINDTLGHARGDAILRVIGACIHAVFRGSDILSRFGGDEFVLFLPRVGEPQLIEERMRTLIRLIRRRLAEETTPLTASIGAALYPADGSDYATLFHHADEALYAAKRQGKNGYAFYGEESSHSFDAEVVPGQLTLQDAK